MAYGRRPKIHAAACLVALTVGTVAACSSSGSGASGHSSAPGAKASSSDTVTVDGIAFPKPEKTELTIGVSSIDVSGVPIFLIPYLKYDKAFGMTVKIKPFQGSSQNSQALLAGQIDAAFLSAGNTFTTLKTDRPEVITYVTLGVDTDILYGNKHVKTKADLKGKSVAVSSFGSQSYAGALLALKSLGLTTKDVTIVPVGNDAAREAALKAGGVGSAILDYTLENQLNKAGFTSLVHIEDIKTAGYPLESLTFPQSFVDKYPNTVLAMTAMAQMGTTQFLKNTPANTTVWAKESQEPTDQAKAEVTQRATGTWRPLDGKCDPASMDFVKTVQLAADKSLKDLDPQKACTNEFVDKLASMGFDKALGVPGY